MRFHFLNSLILLVSLFLATGRLSATKLLLPGSSMAANALLTEHRRHIHLLSARDPLALIALRELSAVGLQ